MQDLVDALKELALVVLTEIIQALTSLKEDLETDESS